MTINNPLPELEPYKDRIPEFIMKLYHILEVTLYEIKKKKEHEEYLTWNGDEEIVIKQIKKFEEKVLPKYFRHKHLSSFIRQLNMYRFSKVPKLVKEKNHMYFKNEYFRRGEMYTFLLHERELLLNLKRNTKKNRGTEETMPMTQEKIDEVNEESNSENVSINEKMHENEKSEQNNEKLQSYKQYVKDSANKIFEIVNKVSENKQHMEDELKTVVELCQELMGVKKEEVDEIKEIVINGSRESYNQMSFLNISQLGLPKIEAGIGLPSLCSLYNFNSLNRL